MKKLMETVKGIKIEERIPKFEASDGYQSKWLNMINRCLKYKNTFNMGRVGYYEEFGIQCSVFADYRNFENSPPDMQEVYN